MNCRFSDSMSITLLLQILCLGSAAAFLGDDLSTAARIRGTTQVQTASINASSLLSSGESTLHLGYMPAEDYGLNESVTFRRGKGLTSRCQCILCNLYSKHTVRIQ